ncbi:hypothetical protein BGZ51_007268 [Haplosporangium sp. Z 767]|nr:hypothetical protein BGZ51_007268 [Haplosporangium sp. Z 767]
MYRHPALLPTFGFTVPEKRQKEMEPVVNSTEFCDWRGQKIWEFSRNDRAFRPRPTEGFVFWCTGYFFFRCVLAVFLLVGVNEGKRTLLENFADLPWVFVSGAMGFYLVGIIYATPASFSTHNSLSSKKRRSGQQNDFNTNDIHNAGRFSSMMEPKRVYLPSPMVLNFTLLGLTFLPLVVNQILASFAGAAFDRGDLDMYSKFISAMYGVWAFVVAVIFVLYLFFGKQLLTIISSNMASINDNVGRVSSRIGADSEYTERDDSERQLNTLKSTYQRMRAILILCGSLSAIMGFMMLFFAIFRWEILHDYTASETFALIWIHGARTTPCTPSMMTIKKDSSYELHYFPIHGRGATSRAILSIAGVNWKDRIQSFEAWPQDKPNTPFGLLPILTVRDSQGKTTHTFPEAEVIESFLAKEFGFFGSNPEEELQISIALSLTNMVYNVWVFRVLHALAPVRDQVLRSFQEFSLKHWIQNCEKLLKANGSNGHFVGERTSLADIKAAVVLDTFLGLKDSAIYLGEESAPELRKVKQLVDKTPGYEAYRKSNAFQEQDEMTRQKVVTWIEGFDMTRAHLFA